MAKLAIKGHSTRGSEVIALLEMMGGVDWHGYAGNRLDSIYYISENEAISFKDIKDIDFKEEIKKFVILTLEEFEQKFPYKVGDKVVYKIYGIHSKIKTMLWNVEKEQVFYRLDSNKLFVATANELKSRK